MKKVRKFIFVSGGVISGIGKGITTASIGRLLQAKGYRVSAMKIDMYLNIDAGTIRPQEHGEVFVTDDGLESDQDLGNYERFLEDDLTRANYGTTGQVYAEVLRKERAFEYEGEDVEAIPHVTDEIIRRIELALEANGAEILLVELGGTVGEYQNALFFEATRIMKLRWPGDVLQVHVGYLPIPSNLGEMKSKPVQQSVKLLNSMGIQPDLIVGRAAVEIDARRRERLALFCNVHPEDVISNPDVNSIYEIPLIFESQQVGDKILKKLGLPTRTSNLTAWKDLVRTIEGVTKPVKIAVVGKYFATGDFMLSDVYISVIEALKHGAWANKLKLELEWVDSLQFEKDKERVQLLKMFDGIVVPGGFGSRGIDGILRAIEFAREEKIPYLGLCYGMQLAVVEFARHVADIYDAHTTEIDPQTPHPVVHVMPDQEKKLLERDYGATMRLGAWDCRVLLGTQAHAAYFGNQPKREDQSVIRERHRHRYEVNNAYRGQLEKAGLVFSGLSPDGKLVEIAELPAAAHPFFVGTQFHPEFLSRPLRPHPLFSAFMRAASGTRSRA